MRPLSIAQRGHLRATEEYAGGTQDPGAAGTARGVADYEGVDMAESTALTPAPESRLDGCPECVLNTETPTAWIGAAEDCVCAYVCSDCGNRWITSWKA